MEDKKNIQSLVKAADSISGSFTKLRFITIACMVFAFAVAVVCVGYSIYSVKSFGDKIYVVDRGQVSLASREDAAVTRRDEIENLAVAYHRLFFNVSPVEKIIRDNLNEALSFTADNSLYDFYNDLQESGFYQRLIQANAMQEIQVDSVQVNMNRYPYPVQVTSTLYQIRQSVMTRQRIITQMYMTEVPRDAKNLHGLKISGFILADKGEPERRERK